ncbi:hepatic sodium/bile acid cotransporter-like isoform X2 [Cloeon dipterum]
MREVQASAFASLFFYARLAVGSAMMNVIFEPSSIRQLEMMSNRSVIVWTNHSHGGNMSLCAFSSVTEVADVTEQPLQFELAEHESHSKYKSNFTIAGKFLGYSSVYLRTCAQDASGLEIVQNRMFVSVINMDNSVMDHFFIVSLAIVIFTIHINFGCALDLAVVRNSLKKPIGITIGIFSQFVFMPLMSFVAARLLFPEQPALQLGLFFTGCSPGGTTSNLWTLVLDGNLDLSVTMTAVSTFASFLTIPFWVFSLGHVIFAEAEIGVPYKRMAFTTTYLFAPLLIGIFIQCKFPKVAKILAKTLKPLAGFLLVYAIIASYPKLYLLKFVNLRLLVACISNPLLGFIFGALVSTLFKQTEKDIIAISIETGIQNMPISVLLLKTVFERPESDISEVVPLSIFVATQVPLGLLLVILKICKPNQATTKEENEIVYMVEDNSELKKKPTMIN